MYRALLFIIGMSFMFEPAAQTAIKTGNQKGYLPQDTVVERLVLLALKNPRIKNAENLASQSNYEYKRSQTAWLNNITFAANLNEVSLKRTINSDPIAVQSTQYPRYNVGVYLPLGIITNNKKQSKSLYFGYQSGLEQVKMQKNEIRRLVSTYYEDYLLYQNLIALQHESLQDSKVLYDKTEEKFQKGQATLEEFSAQSKVYNSEKVREVTLKHSINLAQFEIEELIGMKLSEALREINTHLK